MQEPKRFPRGARVIFIGDSITCKGTFIAHIQDYYRTRFPADKVKCFNAGVSGGTVKKSALPYLEKDLSDYEPTHAVIMLGMNDRTEPQEDYFLGMEELAEKLHARGISMIFCTPTPIDSGRAPREPETVRAADKLTGFGYFCRGLAMKYGAPVVDFNGIMTAFLAYMQAKNPNFTLHWQDRIHPTPELGHVVMALAFLRAQGFTDIPEPTAEAYEKGNYRLFLSEKNQKRYDKEQIVRLVRCADYLVVGHGLWKAPFEERMKPVTACLEKAAAGEEKNAYIETLAREYERFAPAEEEHIADLLALTDALYE